MRISDWSSDVCSSDLAIRLGEDDYKVFGGRANEGAVIVSQEDYPVDFSRNLACRVGNIVPIDTFETAVRSVNAYTQTIGIYPERLKEALRDRLAFQGAQRIVDRKSVVLGKSVSVRVDLGGRRLIKKKKRQK